MEVTIKENCKSVLLDNGIEPPMLMDIESFIQMAIESRNEMADKLQQAEAQAIKMRGAIDYTINRLDNTQYDDCVGVAASRHWIKRVCQEALETDSGTALLKELAGLRSGLERIQDYAISYQDLNTDMKEIVLMATEALAEVEKEE